MKSNGEEYAAEEKEIFKMSLTRKMLKAMSIDDDKIEQIIEAHTETVTGLKETADKYKADADKLLAVEKELETVKKNAENSVDESYKARYEAMVKELETYKSKEIRNTKERAYRQLLKSIGIADKRIDSVIKVSDLQNIQITDDGKIKDGEKLSENLKDEWADFIVKTGTKGAEVPNPPSDSMDINYDDMSDSEYYKATYEKMKK